MTLPGVPYTVLLSCFHAVHLSPPCMSMITTYRSVAAIIFGIVAGAVLSILTDTILEQSGIAPSVADQLENGSPTWILILATVYRSIYTAVSGYLGAALAPSRPMRHAMILGGIAFVANLAGGIAMWEYGQHWYPAALAVLAIPSALYGGKLHMKKNARAA